MAFRHVRPVLTIASGPHAPRVLCSARVLLSTGVIATTTRSAPLRGTGRLHLQAYTPGLAPRRPPGAAPERFPTLDRCPFERCHHPARRGEDQLHVSGLRWPHRTSPRHGRLVSPVSALDALVFAHATAPFFARASQAGADHRACTASGRPGTASVFATAPSDRAPVGLSPTRPIVVMGCTMPSRLPPRARVTKAGPLPSGGVVAAAINGTTSPSDSLPARRRFALGLSASLCPDKGGRVGPLLFRAGLSPRASLRTPEASCARMQSHAPGSTDTVCCLRRDMIGSAASPFGSFISRGCKVHAFALRPATLLPSQQPYGHLRALDAPLRQRALAPHPEPATRLSGDYRGGTFTRKSSTARNSPAKGPTGFGRTYHW